MSAIKGCIPYVNGTIRATPVEADSPGMTPTNIPMMMPPMITMLGSHQAISDAPWAAPSTS